MKYPIKNMPRFGMCCIFRNEPVSFKITTAKYIKTLSRAEQLSCLSSIVKNNAKSLMNAFVYCRENGIGDFRVNSRILPLKTHPEIGYEIDELPDCESIIKLFRKCGSYAEEKKIRTTFHPDQFILLSSPSETVTENSIRELFYQAEVAGWIHADIINIHADFIDIKDFPLSWLNLDITIEIEAKLKELAVLKLIKDIRNMKKKYATAY